MASAVNFTRTTMHWSPGWLATGAACVLLQLVGCGGGTATNIVTGKVTYQGNPIPQGTINFRAADGKLFGGGLSADGGFEFELPDGDYEVRVDAPAPMPSGWKEGDPLPTNHKRLAPLKYANFGSSGLIASISADPSTHQLDFGLE